MLRLLISVLIFNLYGETICLSTDLPHVHFRRLELMWMMSIIAWQGLQAKAWLNVLSACWRLVQTQIVLMRWPCPLFSTQHRFKLIGFLVLVLIVSAKIWWYKSTCNGNQRWKWSIVSYKKMLEFYSIWESIEWAGFELRYICLSVSVVLWLVWLLSVAF